MGRENTEKCSQNISKIEAQIEKLRTKYETEMDQLKKRLEEEKKSNIN